MHGIIHAELKKFVDTNHGPDAWAAILKEAGLENKTYITICAYPDEETLAIVKAASSLTHTPAEQILESFGEFIVQDLVNMYRSLIKPEWKTMGLLLHAEETIHRVVRMKNKRAKPPQLQFEAIGPSMLKFTYSSPRRLSSVARGIIKGVAKHYGETVTILERKGAVESI